MEDLAETAVPATPRICSCEMQRSGEHKTSTPRNCGSDGENSETQLEKQSERVEEVTHAPAHTHSDSGPLAQMVGRINMTKEKTKTKTKTQKKRKRKKKKKTKRRRIRR